VRFRPLPRSRNLFERLNDGTDPWADFAKDETERERRGRAQASESSLRKYLKHFEVMAPIQMQSYYSLFPSMEGSRTRFRFGR